MKKYINLEQLTDILKNLYKDVLEQSQLDMFEDNIDEWAEIVAESICTDMDKYVHMKDTKIIGNFANIRQDWEITTGFVDSEITPWGKFDDVIASIDNGTISAEDLERFQTWCLDWFFTAFGTYNLKYNFQEYLLECVDEYES